MKTRFDSPYLYVLFLSGLLICLPAFAQTPGQPIYNPQGQAGYGQMGQAGQTGYGQATAPVQPAPSVQPAPPAQPAQPVPSAYGQLQNQPQAQPQYPPQYPPQAQPVSQPQALNAPFQLTPQQQLQVDQVLTFWEKYTRGVKKFESEFDLYTYPAVSVGGADVNSVPQSQKTAGFLKYESPNKGIYRVDGPPKELHRCNGKSLFSYNFDKMEINEYPFSSEESQELDKGPMAFLFGASASTIRDRYWIRLVTPQEAPQGQIWLEAYPKTLEDRQDLVKAELIIQVKPVQPVAFQKYAPNGDRQVYSLKNVKVNKFELFGREPFEPNERGFTLIKDNQ